MRPPVTPTGLNPHGSHYRRDLQRRHIAAQRVGVGLGLYVGHVVIGPPLVVFLALQGHWLLAILFTIGTGIAVLGWGRDYGYDWTVRDRHLRRNT